MYWRKVTVCVFVLVALAVIFYLGVIYGENSAPYVDRVSYLKNKENNISQAVDFEPFWRVWSTLNDKYVPADASTTTAEEQTLFTQKLVWGAISGLTAAVGDPYTIFLPPEESEIFKSDINGNFSGVGMEIGIRHDTLVVISPLKGSPAEAAGIKPGDKIHKIDDEATLGMRLDEAVTKIRGPEDTEVRLLLQRDDKDPFEVVVTRKVIDLPTLDTETLIVKGEKIFVIRLYSFSTNSLSLFSKALEEFINAGTDKLIIDLRGNPGGYMEASIEMASFFLADGKVVVREYFGVGEKETVHRSKGYDIFSDELKMAVLIDNGSASASEILAGALSEHGEAILVGERTFGKGSVQELVDISSGTSLKVTVARWLTPFGKSISDTGLMPDFEVKFTPSDIEEGKDTQMDFAVEKLLNMN